MFLKRFVLSGVAVLLAVSLAGCGGSSSKPVSVALSSTTATVDPANTLTLTATVANDKNNDGVTWTQSGGGSLTTTTTTATFTAPAATSSVQTITITATSVADPTQSVSATLTIPAQLTITTTGGATGSLAGQVGTVYSVQLQTTTGVPPYTWTLAPGNTLPACLSMTSSGLITSNGPLTANCAIDPNITFDVTDSGTPPMTASQSLDLIIASAPPVVFSTTTIPPATGTYNAPYSGAVLASGGTGALTYSLASNSGPLPKGLSLGSASGAITGTPTAAGTYPFTIQAADPYGDVNTQAYTITINPATPTLSFAAIATQTYGAQPFQVSATDSASTPSTGAITYSLTSGQSSAGTVTSSGMVTLTGTGTVYLTATQAATANYTAATATTSFTVTGEAPTLTFATIPTETYGNAPFSVSVSDSASTPSNGAITYSLTPGQTSAGTVSSSGLVTITGAGTIYITASQAASGDFVATSVNTTITVAPEAPVLSFAAIAAQTFGAQPIQVSATDSTTTPSTGAITYSLTPGLTSAGTVSPSGLVTITGAGTIYLTATQAASGNYAVGSATTSFTVAQATPTLSFAAISAQTYGNPSFSVNATSASNGAVTYSLTPGQTSAGTVTSTGQVTISGAGTIYLTANQAATANYIAATATTTVTVNPATPTLSFAQIPAQTYGNPSFSVSATSASNGAVTYSLTQGQTSAGSVSTAGQVTISGVGTIYLTATQAATTNYTTATATTSFTVSPATATVVLGSLTQTYNGSSLAATATTTPTGLAVNFSYTGKGGTTYPTSSTAPTNAGTYSVTASINSAAGGMSANYTGSSTGTLTISPASATVTIGSQTQTYTGSPISATATTNPTGISVGFTYTGTGTTTYGPSATAPTNAGTYSVAGTISNPNYTGSGSGTLTISPATATVTIGSQTQTYTGSAIPATVTTAPTGLSVTYSYTGTGTTSYGPSATAPTNAGTYSVAGTISNPNYTGTGSGTLTISPATATVTIGSQTQTYTGSPISATATTAPTGLTVSFTYTGTGATSYPTSSTAPTNAGTYSVAGTISNPNYTGTGSGMLTIQQATATITIGSQTQTYNGSPISASATTSPSGLSVTYSYTGTGTTTYPTSSTPPTNAGTYSVTGTINSAAGGLSANYTGSATGTLTIQPESVNLTFTSVPTYKTYGNPTFSVTASDSTGPVSSGAITYSVTSGPATVGSTTGLVTLSNPGASAGTVWLQANQAAYGNYAAASATANFTVYPTLTLTPTTLPTGVVGTAYNQSLVSLASGGNGVYSWTLASGGANLTAAGLSLSTGTTASGGGVVSGSTPIATASPESFSVTVSDGAGNTATSAMSVMINASLSVSTTTLPYGFSGSGATYSQPLVAVGGSGTYSSWAVTTGGTQLAALGLSLNTSTGVISNPGTLNPGSATFTVKVTDSKGATATSSSLTITIYAPLTLPAASSTTPGPATFGWSYAGYINVTGGSGGYPGGGYSWTITNSGLAAAGFTYTTSGGSPAGSQMYISGTAPSTAQTINFTVKVTDTLTGKFTSAIQYSIVVGPPIPLTMNPASGTALPGAITGENYSNQSISLANGSNSSYAFSVGVNGGTVTAGTTWTLPDNLTASNSGGILAISGKPNATTPITLVIKGTDSGQDIAGPNTYTLAVTNPSPLGGLPAAGALSSATIGQYYSNTFNVTGGDQANYTWTVNTTPLTSGSPFAIGATGISVEDFGGNSLSISGPCTAYGTATLNVSVLDVGTGQTLGPIQYTIACNPQQPLALTPSSNPLPSGTYNPTGVSSYPGAQIYASGGSNSGYVFSVTVGTTASVVGPAMTVPIGNGLTVSASGGTLTIAGTPTQSGDVPLNVTLNDSAGDPVASATYQIALINPAAGYTVSGNISYSGSHTGWTYIRLNNLSNGNSSLGTAISEAKLTAGGAYTIHGVTPGIYEVNAFMDTLNNGSQNAADPTGYSVSSVTVSTGNVTTGANVQLQDPSGLSLNSSPTWDSSQGFGAFSGGALIDFDIIKSNNIEQAAGYTVQWSTDSSFITGVSSQCFPATGSGSWIVTGISGSGPYYFRAAGILGSCATPTSTGPWSAPSPAMTITAPAGNAVSGTVTIPSTVTPTGPLYVGFYNSSTSQIYATEITTPSNSTPNSYSVNVPTGSGYFLFGILDQNITGVINAPGEISNTNQNNMTTVSITGTTTGMNLDLTPYAANVQATVRTQNQQSTGLNGVTTNSYGLDFQVQGLVKLPVSVELATESTPGVLVPTDVVTGAFNGNTDEFDYSPNLNGDIPAQGDHYNLLITYSDSTPSVPDTQTVTVTVGAPLNAFATNLAPDTTGISMMPGFSWSYPTNASSYNYRFQLHDSNGNRIWRIPGDNSNSNYFPSTTTPAITWAIDPTGSGSVPSVPLLNSDSTYWWEIDTTDANGDEATTEVAFKTLGTSLSLPTTNPITLPTTAIINQNYYGSVSVIGGVEPYNWNVNWNTDNDGLYWNTGADGSSLIIQGTPPNVTTAGNPVTFQATVYDSTGASFGPETYTIAVNPYITGDYPVYGQITFNGCGTDEPPVTLTLTSTDGHGISQTAISDSTGMYEFPSVPNGAYSITPSITGPATSILSPTSLPVTVNGTYVNNNNFNATVGYTVTGMAGYDGAQTGPIYLSMDGCTTPSPGTAITAPGAFTIHGVPPGVYTINAWMDGLKKGVPNLSDPSGSTHNVVVPNANDANLSVGLTDPAPATLSYASGIALANGFANGAVLNISPVYLQNSLGNGAAEAATSYTVQWSTTSNFSTIAGSASFPAAGWDTGYWILNTATISGLTQGDAYYFRTQGVAGTSTSNWSNVMGPVTISAPPTSNTVSGQITFSQKATGPLYVGFFNQNTMQVYLTQVGTAAAPPTSPASYSLQVPTGNNYYFFAALDQNNDGIFDPGDITSFNSLMFTTPAVSISGPATENLTLPSGHSTAVVRTQNSYTSLEWGAPGQGYNLLYDITPVGKLPISVELTSAPAGSNIVTPADIAWCFSCGSEDVNSAFNFTYNLGSTAPTVGAGYGVKVGYPDGTFDTLTPQVTGVVPNWPTNLSPVGPQSVINDSPDFTWSYPASAGSYLYHFWLGDDNWNTVWSIPNEYNLSNDFTSALSPSLTLAGGDPTDPINTPSISTLTTGAVYNWDVEAFDSHGNMATYLSDLVSGFTTLALPNPNPSSLPSAYLGQSYTGTITATGGYGGYSYSVNGNNCWSCGSVSIGNGLFANIINGVVTISGSPYQTGTDSFTVYAVDTTWSTTIGPVTYTINIGEAPVTLSGPTSSSAFTGSSFSENIFVSGGSGSSYAYKVGVDGGAYNSVPNYPSVLPLADGLTASFDGFNELMIGGTLGSTPATISLSVYAQDNQGNHTTQSYTITAIAPPNGANNKYLNGTYVCKMDGFNDSDSSRWTSVSSFKANGAAGTITSGMWDTNGRDLSSAMSGTMTGTYSIGADNNGLMTINSIQTSGGSGTHTGQYAIALNNTGSATTATEFRMVEIDDAGSNPSGQTGTADCYQASTGVFGTDIFKGNSFVFEMNGENGSGNPNADLGRFVTSGGSITGGVIDQAKITNASAQETILTGGSYTVPDATNGRSTLTFTVSGTNGGTATFEVYVIDANRMFLIDTGEVRALSGDVRKQQQATYSGTNLNGPFVIYTQGSDYQNSAWGYSSELMQGTGNGVVSTGIGSITINQSYKDDNGTYKAGSDTGGPIDVTFDAANPGRVTFSAGGSDQGYLYFFNNNSAFEMDFNGPDNYLETGWVEPQSESTFTYYVASGDFLFGQLPRMEAGSNGNVGELQVGNCASSASSCGFTGSVTTGGEGDFSWDQSIGAMTYNWDTTVTGTGSYLVGSGSKGISCIVISGTRDACIFNGDTPSVVIMQQ